MPEAIWNLCDALSPADGPRRFALPMVRLADRVAPERFTITQATSFPTAPIAEGGGTLTAPLTITVTPPQTGTTEVLPDPAARIFAMARGRIFFLPADQTHPHRLALYMTDLVTPNPALPPWWQRWEEVGLRPLLVVYEQIDRTALEQVVAELLRARQTDPRGLQRPRILATPLEQAAYAKRFLAGDPQAPLYVAPGDYLGAAAVIDAQGTRQLTLTARYAPITDPARPHINDPNGLPMNPRELFNLLFGNDSREAQQHPLLVRMQQLADASDLQPETRRMYPRPPLRTWKRVMWEAELESRLHRYAWSKDRNAFKNTQPQPQLPPETAQLGRNRLLDSEQVRRTAKGVWKKYTLGRGSYANENKCNVFVGDICVRSGFRAIILGISGGVSTALYHYERAGTYAKRAHSAAQNYTPGRGFPLFGDAEDRQIIWGFQLTAELIQRSGDVMAWMNEQMHIHGRCFVMAGDRKNISGHIVFLQKIQGVPEFGFVRDVGLQTLTLNITTYEARGVGADPRIGQEFGRKPLPGSGRQVKADFTHNFINLHLIEIHPGGDPDTTQGLRDLNIW